MTSAKWDRKSDVTMPASNPVASLSGLLDTYDVVNCRPPSMSIGKAPRIIIHHQSVVKHKSYYHADH